MLSFLFFFNDTATTEIYTLSLHDALPILRRRLRRGPALLPHLWCPSRRPAAGGGRPDQADGGAGAGRGDGRSEEHTSELQSHVNLVCRLLLEKKKKKQTQGNRSML